MPEIKEYVSRAEVPGPIGRVPSPLLPLDVGTRFGGAISSAGRMLSERTQRREVLDAHVNAAAARAKLTQDLSDQSKAVDVTDPAAVDNFVDKFSQHVDEHISALQGNYTTAAGADAAQLLGANLKAELTERAVAEQSLLGGAHERSTAEQVVGANTTALFNDPTQYDAVIKSTSDAFDAYTHLNGAQREELKDKARHDYVVSAFRGLSAIDPHGAAKELAAGKWDDRLTGAGEKELLTRIAETDIRAHDEDIRRDREMQKIAQEDRAKAEMKGYLTRMFPVEGDTSKKPVSATEIANNPHLDYTQSETMIRALAEKTRGDLTPKHGNQAMAAALAQRLYLPEDDKNAIQDMTPVLKAFADPNGINESEFKFLSTLFDAGKTVDGRSFLAQSKTAESAARDFFMNSPFKSIAADELAEGYNHWVYDLTTKAAALRSQGKDARVLLTPGKPEYMLAPEVLHSYAPNATFAMRNNAAGKAPAKSRDEAQPGERYTAPDGSVRVKQ